MNWDAIGVIVIGLAVWVGLCAPLIPGPYGAGVRALTRCETPVKFGWAVFAGTISAMLIVHFLAVRGLI